jgi:hypothetical protein
MKHGFLSLALALGITSIAWAQADKPSDVVLANAYLRVEYTKLLMQSTLVMGEKAKIELAGDPKIPTEVIVEVALERLMTNHAESMQVNDELAKQLLAGTFRDDENRKFIKATLESLSGEKSSDVPSYVKAMFRMYSRCTQWKLEAIRRLIEPSNTGRAPEKHPRAENNKKPEKREKKEKKDKPENQDEPQ